MLTNHKKQVLHAVFFFFATLYRRKVINLQGLQTFGKSTTLDVSSQWSTSFGVGLQYQIAPHVGFFVEPSLQYFIPDGSTIQSYRTEHPLQITLPLGIRFNW